MLYLLALFVGTIAAVLSAKALPMGQYPLLLLRLFAATGVANPDSIQRRD